MSKSNPTGKKYSSVGWERDGWILPQSGLTSEPSQETSGVESWIASLVDSHASPSPSPGTGEGQTIPAISGPRLTESFARLDPESQCWRTYRASFQHPTGEPYSQTWPRAGSMSNGTVCRQVPLVPLTDETDYGFLLPTPQVADMPNKNANTKRWGGVNSLTAMAKTGRWPTPKASDGVMGLPRTSGRSVEKVTHLATAAKYWPTPQARDWKEGHNNKPHGYGADNLALSVNKWPTPRANKVSTVTLSSATKRLAKKRLEDHAAVADQQSGSLNPTWVELLMGFPTGWTDINPLQVVARHSRQAWQDGSWEDGIPRVANGIPFRVDRLKALGDAVVSQQAMLAWELLTR